MELVSNMGVIGIHNINYAYLDGIICHGNTIVGENTCGSCFLISVSQQVEIINSQFYKNRADWGYGGGFEIDFTKQLTIKNCIFEDNFAYWHGGAIEIHKVTKCNISNSSFSENKGICGGGIFF